jgi:hypothetical protein
MKSVVFLITTISLLQAIKTRFYGLIGPNAIITEKMPLYQFFTKPGVIQGVFLENKKTHFISHKIPSTNDAISVANTAILKIPSNPYHKEDRFYALYERDCPVEIAFNIENKTIKTIRRIEEAGICSGHTKWNGTHILSLHYSILHNTVTFTLRNPLWKILQEYLIHVPVVKNSRILPIIHEFVMIDDDAILITLTPFTINWNGFCISEKGNTIFAILNITEGTTHYYPVTNSLPFLIFHYSSIVRIHNQLWIYSPQYDSLEYTSSPYHLKGRYRKCVIDLKEKTAKVERMPEWEFLNLDFPVKVSQSRNTICMRMVSDDFVFDRLVFLEGFTKVGEYHFTGRFLMGEPAWDMEREVLCGLSVEIGGGRKFYWELGWPSLQYDEIEMNVNTELFMGFHSGMFLF